MDKSIQYMFKIILIGDSGVGKTSLMMRFTENTCPVVNLATIGVDFKIKTIEVDGHRVKLQVWDTAGQERFRAMVSNYYRGAQGIFIVFDMLNRATFDHLDEWIGELEKKGAVGNAEIMILGNKVEKKGEVAVTDEEVNEFLEKHKIPKTSFVPVSAVGDIGVEEGFKELTRRLISKFGAVKMTSKAKPVFDETFKKKACC